MPEFYAEPMKDRRSCFVCEKKLHRKLHNKLTCIKCHAITYCGRDCQSADWDRHKWNCVPVMVMEFPGKGRGLVAARDIEKGELIFKDEALIKLAVDAVGHYVDPDFMTSLKQQIDSLPSEAQAQYNKLMTHDKEANIYHVSNSDREVLKLFMANAKTSSLRKSGHSVLHLNITLMNHSCAPNATVVEDEDGSVELRAFKNISKGEEISICYFGDVKSYGSVLRKWKTALKKDMGFDCKCPVCMGQVRLQEKTLKKLIELHNKLNPTSSDWKKEAGIRSRMVDLTMELNIGQPDKKMVALEKLMKFAHLARDKDLVMKSMDMMRQFAEETKVKGMQRMYESW